MENIWERASARAAAMADMRVVPPLPLGRLAGMPALDAEEPPAPPPGGEEQVDRQPLGLFLVYVDAAGARSERRVTVRHLAGHPRPLLVCYCHERRAPRNFRLDRIEEAIVPGTGEVLAGAELAAWLRDQAVPAIDHMLRRAINILVFLARCDGRACPAEWEEIDRALASWLLRFGGDDADHARAMHAARAVAPDTEDFLIGMRSFVHSPDPRAIRRWLAQHALAVIDADGVHTREETIWMAEAADFMETLKWARR